MIELVVVLFIIALLAFLGIVTFGRFRQTAGLDTSKQVAITALLEARALSLSSNAAQTYGVHFETAKVVRFTGTSYATGTASNVSYKFDSRVRMVSLSLTSGGSDVYFKRLTGEASKSGTLVIAAYQNSANRATTTISSSGIVE